MQAAEADEVEQELAAMFARGECVELLDGVHPFHAELGFFGDGWDVLDDGCEESGGAQLFVVGDVVVEQRRGRTAHAHGLLEEPGGRDRGGLRES